MSITETILKAETVIWQQLQTQSGEQISPLSLEWDSWIFNDNFVSSEPEGLRTSSQGISVNAMK